MKNKLFYLIALLFCACSVEEPTAQKEYNTIPEIFPDYTDVTIPVNIAPLRFKLTHNTEEAIAVLTSDSKKIIEKASDDKFMFEENEWKELLTSAVGKDIQVKVYEKENGIWAVYNTFAFHVASDDIDSHLAYRLIPPGYEPWYHMGIYQRNLTSYEEKAIIENSQTDHNCMNCHSFPMQNPEKMVFHMRAVHGGTYVIDGTEIEKLEGKVGEEIPSFVYPSWHPSGEFIAFSNNKTLQSFHRNDKNRIEVYDEKSNVFVYSVKEHKVYTDSLIFSPNVLETFPTFSADGKTLYFCSAEVSDSMKLPRDYKKIKYSLCSIAFNPENKSFGSKVDTLYNAKIEGKSAKFPRVSPNGKYLIFTLSEFGNFSIWHHDADMYLYDFQKNSYQSLTKLNSSDTESYHSWASNSHWLVFSSRRDDGLYTRPYIAHVNENGETGKPFLVPQEDPDFYKDFMFSYNIPELIKHEVNINSKALEKIAKNGKTVQIHR